MKKCSSGLFSKLVKKVIKIFQLKSIKIAMNTPKRSVLCPPPGVRGMTQLDRSAFTVRVDLPTIYVPANRTVSDVVSRLKRHDLLLRYRVKVGMKRRMRDVSDAYDCSESRDSPEDVIENHCTQSESLVPIVLNPEKMQLNAWSSLPPEIASFLGQFGVTQSCNFRTVTASIDYQLWTKEDIFRAVLPEGEHTVSGYSIVGHIVHVNLKESLYPYKALIGQVLLDKVPQAKTVINKVKNIDSAYRNFEIELLAGESNYKTRVKENGCLFDLDYAQVYWNSRLCTEHKRVVDFVQKGDLVIDGFAGIGPFAVLAAKMFALAPEESGKKQRGKKQPDTKQPLVDAEQVKLETVTPKTAPIRVLANDLNPQACYWLRHNMKLNKIPDAMAECHNMDAAEFFQSIVKPELLTFLASPPSQTAKAHIIMNLPATAVTFLPCFLGLLSDSTDYESPSRLVGGELDEDENIVVQNNANSSSNNGEVDVNASLTHQTNKGRDIALGIRNGAAGGGYGDEPSTPLPIFVYVYTFSRADDPVDDAVRQACDALCLSYPPNPALVRGYDVRNVAPSKQMICVQVQLTQRTLFEVRQRPPSGSHRSSPD